MVNLYVSDITSQIEAKVIHVRILLSMRVKH